MTPLRLGRLAPKPVAVGDLTHYLTAPLPDPPPSVVAPDLSYPMACNDQAGDCTIAGVVHTDQATAALTRESWVYAGDEAVLTQYFKLTGGQDMGLAETDVLRVWSTTGLFGCTLAAFAPLNVRNTVTIRQAVALCGAVYTGVIVAAPCQQQFAAGEPWDLTGTPADDQIEGGHCVPAVGYNQTGPVFVTWGRLQQATWAWWAAYGEEAYAVVTGEVKERGSLNGVDLAALEADIEKL